MVEVSVAARLLGVSDRRVRSLLAEGKIVGTSFAGRWDVDPRSLTRPKPSSRPMSARIAWAFADMADGGAAEGLLPEERYRLRRRLSALRASSDPVTWIYSRLARRADRVLLWSVDPDSVLGDHRIVASGVCDSRADMTVSSYAEGYVGAGEYELFTLDQYLIPAGDRVPNVVLHVCEQVPTSVPLMCLIADLADYGPGRERAQAEELARSWQQGELCP